MKRKAPKCVKCHKPMKRMYTKNSYKLEGKYKTYWKEIGWICKHVYYPYVIIDINKEYFGISKLIPYNDHDIKELFVALNKIFKKY